MRLVPEQIERFRQDGFLVLPELFRLDELRTMRGAFDALRRAAQQLDGRNQNGAVDHRGSRFVIDGPPGPGVRIQRVVWCGAAEPELLRFGRDPRLLEPAAQLLDSRTMEHLINQAHFKLPGDGVVFPWHQDSAHRRYGTEWMDLNGTGSYVQSVLAVDDMTADNGPLRFIPGSQRLGHLGSTSCEGPEGLPEPVRRLGEPVSPTAAAGSVILFGPYVWHGSRPNLSTSPRRVLINGYAYPGANSRVYPGDGAGATICAPDSPQDSFATG